MNGSRQRLIKATQEAVKNVVISQRTRGKFYKDLEFGTGGMRGIMGWKQPNNKYTWKSYSGPFIICTSHFLTNL
jgi:hypothetical protein